MLSNEQRAHDLAILMVQVHLDTRFKKSSATKTGESDNKTPVVKIDELYFEMYELTLGAINKHFTD